MTLSRQEVEAKIPGANATSLGNNARHSRENIWNFIQKEEVPEPKKRMYKSIHDPKSSIKYRCGVL